MSKWVCIDPGGEGFYLTLHKIYDAETMKSAPLSLRVINDNGVYGGYSILRFLRLDEWREQQIKTVLDE